MKDSAEDCNKSDMNNASLPEALKLPDGITIVIINAIFLPFLIISTVVINTLVCLVLLKPHMRTTTNTILTALAASDTLTGLMPLPCYLYFYSARYYQQYLPFSWCFLYFCLTDFLPSIFHTTSVWLTVSLAIQRYISVCHTQLARKLCNVKNACILSLILLTFASLSQLGRFFEMDYKPVKLISKFVVELQTSSHSHPELQKQPTSNLSSFKTTSFLPNVTSQRIQVARKFSKKDVSSDLISPFSDRFATLKSHAVKHGRHVTGLYTETINSYEYQNKKFIFFKKLTKLVRKLLINKNKLQASKRLYSHENEFVKRKNLMTQIPSNFTKLNQKFEKFMNSNYENKILNLLLKVKLFSVNQSKKLSLKGVMPKTPLKKVTDQIGDLSFIHFDLLLLNLLFRI